MFFADRRSENMFLMQSVWMPLGVVAFYLYFVLSLGPSLMKNRPAMRIEILLKAYNLIQIPLCLYLLERVSMLTPWLMEPGGPMPHSHSYPEPNQPNYPH